MRYLKYVTSILLLICILGVTAFADSDPLNAALPYENYTYSEKDGSILLAPQAYLPDKIIYGQDLGIGSFHDAYDLYEDDNGELYLLDSGNNRVVVFSKDLQVARIFTGFVENGATGSFLDARGIFVDDLYVYIADTSNSRVLILDKTNGALVKNVKAPTSSVLGADFVFKPLKLVADSDRLLYIVGEGTYEGIITMDWDSNFLGFIGSNSVNPSAWEIFWMSIFSRAQRESSRQFIPQDFSSIDIDDEGFFFCTTRTKQSDGNMVKRLNPGGDNVIRCLSRTALVGDPTEVARGSLAGFSSFYDVACGENGLYACLDNTRGKIFCYNDDGYLLYTFGFLSTQEGGFSEATALTWLSGSRIAVLDRSRGCFTVFAPTEYAEAIHAGVAAQVALDYDLAFENWMHVLSLNSNYEMAHIEVGKVYLNTGRYKEAMEEFRLGNSKTFYSKAKAEDRSEWIYNNISYILIVLAVLIVFFVVRGQIKKFKRRKRNGE